jgi:hypothetical protein
MLHHLLQTLNPMIMIKRIMPICCLFLLGLWSCGNKSDVREKAQEAVEAEEQAKKTVKEEPYIKANAAQDFSGVFADRNYPDKGFWKKMTITHVAGKTVKVDIVGKEENGMPGCQFSDIGTLVNGRIEIPIEKKEGLADSEKTYMLIQFAEKGKIAVRSRGKHENYWMALALFCTANSTLADNYTPISE